MDHLDKLIAACEQRIRPGQFDYPAHDYQWGILEVNSVSELIERFRFGNYAARSGFVLGDLAFVEQISGGNEWLALKLDEGDWKTFDSISFYHMLRQRGEEECREYIEGLQQTSWYELRYPDTTQAL